MTDRTTLIRQCLQEAFAPETLEIVDESHKHAGHAGARGGGHFTVYLVSPGFAGKSPIERHRMVYAALGQLMTSDIHALSVKALTPEETQP